MGISNRRMTYVMQTMDFSIRWSDLFRLVKIIECEQQSLVIDRSSIIDEKNFSRCIDDDNCRFHWSIWSSMSFESLRIHSIVSRKHRRRFLSASNRERTSLSRENISHLSDNSTISFYFKSINERFFPFVLIVFNLWNTQRIRVASAYCDEKNDIRCP